MDIRFSNIVPTPLSEKDLVGDIWGKEISLKHGNNYHILAPSGKGKSTFAHILYGLRKDYSGNLYWGDRMYSSFELEEIQKARTSTFGIVFQDLRLFLSQTPSENIAIHQSDLSEGIISQEEIQTYASRLGIQDLLEKKCEVLSYGQRQRVAILRALSRSFQWLILDEPFSHLDEDNQYKAGNLILDVVEKNSASMIITGLNKISPAMIDGKKFFL